MSLQTTMMMAITLCTKLLKKTFLHSSTVSLWLLDNNCSYVVRAHTAILTNWLSVGNNIFFKCKELKPWSSTGRHTHTHSKGKYFQGRRYVNSLAIGDQLTNLKLLACIEGLRPKTIDAKEKRRKFRGIYTELPTEIYAFNLVLYNFIKINCYKGRSI